MSYPTNKPQYDKRALKDYIDSYYLDAKDLSKRLFYDDPGKHHLGKKFRRLEGMEFEAKIIEIVNFAKRTGRYDNLVGLLKADNKTNFDTQMNQFMKPYTKRLSSKQSSVNLAFGSHNNEPWAKSSSAVKSSIASPHKYEDKNVNEAEKLPPIDRSFRNIERLGVHKTLLGEIDNLLEGLRKKIGELNLNISVQPQTMLSKTMNVARKPNIFQGKQKASFQVSKSAVAGQQPFTRPNRGWKETQYPKS